MASVGRKFCLRENWRCQLVDLMVAVEKMLASYLHNLRVRTCPSEDVLIWDDVFFSILYLKQIIANKYKIPINKQVLLINGGYCLEDESKIGSYSAGTDTNPIFLFNRSFLDGNEPPFVVAEIRTNNTIGKCIFSLINLNIAYWRIFISTRLYIHAWNRESKSYRSRTK